MSPPPPSFIEPENSSSSVNGMVEKKQITRVACIGAGYVGKSKAIVPKLKG